MTTKNLSELEADLAEATRAFANAESNERAARIAETNARNRLNELQKAFDDRVAEIKGKAPRDTDWNRTRFTVRGDGV